MSRALLREENRLLRKQLEDFRQGIKEPESIKVETAWRRAGEEMCGHVGINPNPKTFMKWIRDRYEAPKQVIPTTNPTVGTYGYILNEAATERMYQNTVQPINVRTNQIFYDEITVGINAPAETVAVAN